MERTRCMAAQNGILLAGLLVLTNPAWADPTDLVLVCTPEPPDRLNCDFRLGHPVNVTGATVRLAGTELPVEHLRSTGEHTGNLTVDVAAVGPGHVANPVLNLQLLTAEGPVEAEIALPAATLEPKPAPTAAPSGMIFSQPSSDWRWYLLPAVLLLALAAIVAATARSRRPSAPPSPGEPVSRSAVPYILVPDDNNRRIPIDQPVWRIGRSRDNDLTLTDPSVSREHCAIHRHPDGRFQIRDLGSMNGVFVNDKKVRACELADGDTLEVGDVRLRFALLEETQADQDVTVVSRTPR